MALQSNPSEWVTGESDPGDFTADAVIEVLKNVDEGEKRRVNDAESDGEERESVLVASDSADDNDESDNESDDESDSPSVGAGEEEEAGREDGVFNPSDYDGYNPYKDPDVPSSFIAQQVATELVAFGKSDTLDTIRGEKQDAEADDSEDDES